MIIGQYNPWKRVPGGSGGGGPVTNPIASTRRVDWSGAGVQGGIPSRSTICTTLSPGVSAATINSAISSCSANGVVLLNAGTYNLSAGITFGSTNSVTLRGSGSNSTFLTFTAGSGCSNSGTADICIQGSVISVTPSVVATVSGSTTQGTKTVTLSTTSGLSTGSTIDFDQLNDTSDSGGTYICNTYSGDSPQYSSPLCSQEGLSNTARLNRDLNQVGIVTTISGSNVTFDAGTPAQGLYASFWSTGKTMQAYWPNSTTVHDDGVENLSVDNSGNSSTTNNVFEITSAKNCWLKNVRSIRPGRSHVLLNVATSHITVRDSYFYGTLNGATSEYGVEVDRASDNLVENNIFEHMSVPFVPMSSEGTIYAYNFTYDCWYASSATWQQGTVFEHGSGVIFNLIEGNVGNMFEPENVHGTKDLETVFRNYFNGRGTNNGTLVTQMSNAVYVYAYNRFMNIVGNVLGTSGYHTHYQCLAPSGTNSNTSVYSLGWSGNEGAAGFSVSNDTTVATTMMRWGNYDVANGSVQWNSAEVPSSDTHYPNSVPANHNLPSSMYLSAQPTWWGMKSGHGTTPPWPPIGPDVTGGSGPGGYAYENPAELCWDNTSATSGIKNFDASACYISY